MTKIIDLTKEAKEQKVLKRIEFVSFLNDHSTISPTILPNGELTWDKLYLLCRDYRDSGLDLMFASNDGVQCLYLGHFNDGIV